MIGIREAPTGKSPSGEAGPGFDLLISTRGEERAQPRMEIEFGGKTVMITGGTHGIGRATAQRMAELGGEVIVVGRNEENGRKLADGSAGKIRFAKADLSVTSEVERLARSIEEGMPRVDVLINCAARNSRYSVLTATEEEWDEMLRLNLTAPFLISKAVAGRMAREKVHGKIINVGAVQAEKPLNSAFCYSTVKGALLSMSRSMAVDLSRFGIQVMYLMVGPIYAKPEGDEPPPEMDRRAATLLGRMGRKKEVADLLAFLASDYNTFMTGNVIAVEGGRLISRKPDPVEVVDNLFDPLAVAQLRGQKEGQG